jgi:hypothetical protein
MDPVAHASVGVMAKSAAPKAPLWVLVAATQVPDLLFFAFEAAGIEHQAVTHMDFRQGLTYLSPALIPWSHGLFMCVVWSVLVAALGYLFFRDLCSSGIKCWRRNWSEYRHHSLLLLAVLTAVDPVPPALL